MASEGVAIRGRDGVHRETAAFSGRPSTLYPLGQEESRTLDKNGRTVRLEGVGG